MTYEWEWLNRAGKRILFVKFPGARTADAWLDFFTEALSDFNGGQLEVLCDARLGEGLIDHDGFLKILKKLESKDVEGFIVAMIISDRFYDDKIKMFNMYAEREGVKFTMKAFSERDAAEKWLVEYTVNRTGSARRQD